MKKIITIFLFTLIYLFSSSTAQALILDQFQLLGNDQNQAIHSTRPVVQTFTVGQKGLFSGLEIILFEYGDGPGLRVEILDLGGGDIASAPVLASALLEEGDLGPAPINLTADAITATYIDFSSSLFDVDVGDSLAFKLSTDRELIIGAYKHYFVTRIAFNDPYSGGFYTVGPDYGDDSHLKPDAAFKTFVNVNTVPEPSTIFLISSCLITIAGIRIRKIKSGSFN